MKIYKVVTLEETRYYTSAEKAVLANYPLADLAELKPATDAIKILKSTGVYRELESQYISFEQVEVL